MAKSNVFHFEEIYNQNTDIGKDEAFFLLNPMPNKNSAKFGNLHHSNYYKTAYANFFNLLQQAKSALLIIFAALSSYMYRSKHVAINLGYRDLANTVNATFFYKHQYSKEEQELDNQYEVPRVDGHKP